MQPVYVSAYSVVTACGQGCLPLRDALWEQRSCLRQERLIATEPSTFTGEISFALPEVCDSLIAYNTRNARLALAAVDCEEGSFRKAVLTAIDRYGATRVGVIIGTSTSGIYETECAYQVHATTGAMPDSFNVKKQHAWIATAEFLKLELGLAGPCYAISTACSSSSKSISAGQRLIETGLCDAVVVGGVDSICHLTLYGFQSLDLVSEKPCMPLDRDRNGISIGEGAGLLLIERQKTDSSHSLIGYGESSDAHHMTAPHPQGEGAAQAMHAALQTAELSADDIDYVNLHATATPLNDLSEMQGMASIFANATPRSATKGITGHTLGAAGAIEAIIAILSLQHGFAPGTCGLNRVDDAFSDQHILMEPKKLPDMQYVMTNNFGFGGNNSSLIFARGSHHG